MDPRPRALLWLLLIVLSWLAVLGAVCLVGMVT
jgi:hypothetical protein